MMARLTVDLPQPDSPTSPMVSPGITIIEKSITAGMTPRRVWNETFRSSISRIVVFALLPASITASLIAERLLAQPIGQKVEPEHEAHHRQRRHHCHMGRGSDPHKGAPVIDHRAPVRAFGLEPQAEEAERAQKAL